MTDPEPRPPGQRPGEVVQLSEGALHERDEQLGDEAVDIVLAQLEGEP